MKHFITSLALLLGMTLCVAASPAHAGRIFVWAESAQFLSTNTVGVKGVTTSADEASTSVVCVDAANCDFQLSGVPFPPDSGNTWAYRIHYWTTDNAASRKCAWDVRSVAQPNATGTQHPEGGTVADVNGTSQTHTVGAPYITPATSAVAVFDQNANANCSSTNCQNTNVTVTVKLDDTTTINSGVCNLRMLEIIY